MMTQAQMLRRATNPNTLTAIFSSRRTGLPPHLQLVADAYFKDSAPGLRADIVNVIADLDAPNWTAHELAELLNTTATKMHRVLESMVSAGEVVRIGADAYNLPGSAPNSDKLTAEDVLQALQNHGYNVRLSASGAVAVRGLLALTYVSVKADGSCSIGSNIQGKHARAVATAFTACGIAYKGNRRDEYSTTPLTLAQVICYVERLKKV